VRGLLVALALLAGCGEPPFVADALIVAPEDHELSAGGRMLDSEPGDDGTLVFELRRTFASYDDALAASPLEIDCASPDGCGPYSLPLTACQRYDLGRLLELEATYMIDVDGLGIVSWLCVGDAGEVSGSARLQDATRLAPADLIAE
jgi:hypothetical protein